MLVIFFRILLYLNYSVLIYTLHLILEAKVFNCFVKLMDRMSNNFPQGTAMDRHLSNINSLIQVGKFCYVSVFNFLSWRNQKTNFFWQSYFTRHFVIVVVVVFVLLFLCE